VPIIAHSPRPEAVGAECCQAKDACAEEAAAKATEQSHGLKVAGWRHWRLCCSVHAILCGCDSASTLSSQNPAIRVVAWEKASSHSSHPDVIAHTNATNAGNKRSFSVAKISDSILTRQKKQQDMGRYEAMVYF
jgi:hypothetical protein